MNSIFASKLYICSSRQDKIKAALTNPINAELVSQIADYLDDEELRKLADKSDKKEESANTDKEDKKKDSEEHDFKDESVHFTPNPRSFPSSERDAEEKEESDIEAEEAEEAEDKEDKKAEDKEDKEGTVESNTYINPSSICINNISGDVNSIKGILNMNDDTKGVTRVNIKNDEMWIYYEDSINLNNIMTSVIELLNASNYFYLEFNRLARSDNAIVFQISMEDTNSDMKPMEGE